MTIAVKNNLLITKGGRLAEDCKCCKDRQACGAIGSSGGAGTTVDQYDVPSRKLTLQLNYEAYSVPDQFIVRADGQAYIDTGSVSGSGSPRFCKPEGIQQIEVEVNGPDGTAWAYSIECPPDDLKDIEGGQVELNCPPAEADYDGSDFVYIKVSFTPPDLSGGCSPDEAEYEFKMCVFDDGGGCQETTTWFAFEAGGSYNRERAYPVSLDEIALLWPDGGGSHVWIWVPSPALTERAGVRVYVVDAISGDRTDGVLLASVEPKPFLCDWFAASSQNPISSQYSKESIGANLVRFAGSLTGWADPGDCDRKVGPILAIPQALYEANPTWANQNWTVCASDVAISAPGNVVNWTFNGVDIANDAALVFAIYNFSCDQTQPMTLPLIVASATYDGG